MNQVVPPREASSFLSRINYSYVFPLLQKGWKSPIEAKDLGSLAENDKPTTQYERLKMHWTETEAFKGHYSRFWRVLYRTYTAEFFLAMIWSILENSLMLVQRIFLREILAWMEDDSDESYRRGILFSAALCIASFSQSLVHHQLYYQTMRTGWCVRMGCTALIHGKMLNSSYETRARHSHGKILNLVSTDVLRFDPGFMHLHFLWLSLVDTTVVYFLIAYRLGYGAAAAGVGLLLVVTMIQVLNTKRLSRYRKETAKATDKRVGLTTQVINGMLSVKGARWETPFTLLISQLRAVEAKWILRSQFLKAFNQGTIFAIPVLASFVIFSIYVRNGNELSVEIVYPVVALLMYLRSSVGMKAARGLETVPEMAVAMRRIQEFLEEEEDDDASRCNSNSREPFTHEGKFNGGNDRDEVGIPLQEALRTKNVPDGCFGQILELSGVCCMWYVPEMVLGIGQRLKSKRKQKLEEEERHQREFAVSGVSFTVSKGELVLIKGPVGCGKSSLLQGIVGESTVVEGRVQLAGRMAYCPQTPWIVSGTVRENVLFYNTYDKDWYNTVVHRCCLDEDLARLEHGDDTEIGERGVNLSGGQKARVALARALYSKADLLILDDPLAAVDAAVCEKLLRAFRQHLSDPRSPTGILLVSHQPRAVVVSDRVVELDAEGRMVTCLENPAAKDPENHQFTANTPDDSLEASPVDVGSEVQGEVEEVAERVKLIEKEDRTKGVVTGGTYGAYAKAAGVCLCALVLVLVIGCQVVAMFADYWFSVWAGESAEEQQEDVYVIVAASLSGATVLLAMSRAFLFFFTTITANSGLHDGALSSLLATRMSFFTANPLGRIINRFSADLSQVDELLPAAMFDVLQIGSTVVATIVLICIAVPWIAIAIPIIAGLFYLLRRYATTSLRELKRLDGIARSPVFSSFAAHLTGVSSIKAYGAAARIQDNFCASLDHMGKPWYWWFISNRWLGFRLDMMCCTLVFLLALFGVVLKSHVSTALYGLAMTYTISMNTGFQYMVRQSSMVETFMTSVERLLFYRDRLGIEPGANIAREAGDGWPAKGEVCFENVGVRYRDDLPVVLREVSVRLPAGVKVGVVGRTGSGKSTLLQAILGLNEVCDGVLLVDGVDVSTKNLAQRREAVTLIPQEPVLFKGTVRGNLDPFSLHSDDDLFAALKATELSKELTSLDQVVDENGSNLSTGHRQLFSLARALLTRPKVVLIDEATANVDFETDAVIQRTLRQAPVFKQATVITIAHRIQTVADSDMILVFDSGRLAESGSPQQLLSDPNSIYSELLAKGMQQKKI